MYATGQNDRQSKILSRQIVILARHCLLTSHYFEPWGATLFVYLINLIDALKRPCPTRALYWYSEFFLTGTCFGWTPGARFSKDPVNTGSGNLPGTLSGDFIGTEVAFLEAPVTVPGKLPGPIKWRAVTNLLRVLHARP